MYDIFDEFKKRKGFTLAEVLVTLAVIGIVAALTIPSLIKNYQEKHQRSACKEAYSVLNQAVKRMQSDKGDFSYYVNNALTFKPDFIQYFKVLVDGNVNDFIPALEHVYKTYSENINAHIWTMNRGQFVIENGMTVFISDAASDFIYLSADVNGHQNKPNVAGKDLFFFALFANGNLLPMGTAGTSHIGPSSCSSNPENSNNYNGYGCPYYIMTNQDFP